MSGSDMFDKCYYLALDDEVMYFTVYSDINDVEGFVFESFAGKEYEFKANGD